MVIITQYPTTNPTLSPHPERPHQKSTSRASITSAAVRPPYFSTLADIVFFPFPPAKKKEKKKKQKRRERHRW
jgi:hypothetical protein